MKIYEPMTPLSTLHGKPDRFLISIAASEVEVLADALENLAGEEAYPEASEMLSQLRSAQALS